MPTGNGTVNNPYQISCWENLYWMSVREDIDQITYTEKMNAHYVQTTDIVFPIEINAWDNNQGWKPLGYYNNNSETDYPFQGVYDGQSFSISNLYIYRGGSHHIGLFGLVTGQLDNPAIIRNVRLINTDIRGSYYCGSLAGKISHTQIINCSAEGFLQNYFYGAGLIGLADYSEIIDSYSTCLVNCIYVRGGLVSELNKSLLINSYYDYESVLINNEHLIYPGAINQSMFMDWLSYNRVLNAEDYFQSDGNMIYSIYNEEDFKKILGFYWQRDYTFSLQNNIDLSDDENFYIPYFRGKLKGNFHQISNLYYFYPFNDFAYRIAFIGQAYQAQVSELFLSNFNITGSYHIGSLCGIADSSLFLDIHSTSNVTGDFYTGGLIGTLENSTLSRSSHQGFSYGYIYAGGLIGVAESSQISDSYSLGSVSTQVYYSGGLCGKSFNSIFQRCYTSTETHSFSRLGGFIGESSNSVIQGSFWNTDKGDANTGIYLTSNDDLSGLFGINSITMQDINTFAEYEWNFETVWNINPSLNYGFPFLRGENPLCNEHPDPNNPAISSESIFIYPNPVRGSAVIQMYGTQSASVNISIYNIKGQKVHYIENYTITKEKQNILWNRDNLASGVYFIVIRNEHEEKIKKVLIVK